MRIDPYLRYFMKHPDWYYFDHESHDYMPTDKCPQDDVKKLQEWNLDRAVRFFIEHKNWVRGGSGQPYRPTDQTPDDVKLLIKKVNDAHFY